MITAIIGHVARRGANSCHPSFLPVCSGQDEARKTGDNAPLPRWMTHLYAAVCRGRTGLRRPAWRRRERRGGFHFNDPYQWCEIFVMMGSLVGGITWTRHQTENPAGKAIHHFKVVGLLDHKP